MYAFGRISQYRETELGTDLIVHIPGEFLIEKIIDKNIRAAEMRLDDGRTISIEQRRKAYATLRDLADWSGYLPEEMKEHMKYIHMEKTGCDYFSLSDCSVDTAREFINTLIEFALENAVPLSELAINRTDDISKYLYYCIKTKRCAVCGENAEIHHVDTIGIGFDRRKVNDADKRKIALCRAHHVYAHQRGMEEFERVYHVYGIVVKENDESINSMRGIAESSDGIPEAWA